VTGRRRAALAALLVLGALALAWVVPVVMDWGRLRPDFEAAASAALGRRVTVSGAVSARLLPSPMATMEGVTAGDAFAERLSVSVKLLPLLGGRREVEHLSLVGGRIGPVDGIAADLASDGVLRARGVVLLPDGGPATLTFEGATDLRKAEGRLRLESSRLALSSSLSLNAEELSLPDIAVTLGQTTASGRVIVSLATALILVDAELNATELDLDPTATTGPAQASPPAAGGPVTAAADMEKRGAGRLTLPGGITANLAVEIGRLRWRGMVVDAVSASGVLEGGVLALNHVRAGLAGSIRVEASGVLSARDGRPAFSGRVRAEGERPRRFRLDSPVELAGERLDLPRLALAADGLSVTGAVTAGLGMPMSLAANLAGEGVELGLDGRMEGGGIAFHRVAVRRGAVALSGTGTLALAPNPLLDARLSAPFIVLDKLGPGGPKRLDDVRLHLVLADDAATVESVTGRLLGGEVSGNGRVTAAGTSLSVRGRGLDIGGLGLRMGDIRVRSGRLDGEVRLSGKGNDPVELLTVGKGTGRVEITGGVVDGFDLAAIDGQMRRLDTIGNLLGLIQVGLNGGQSLVSSLSAGFTLDKGVIDSRDITLVAEGGGATGTALLDLPRDRIDARFAFRLAAPGTPPLGLRLEGRLSAPNKIIDINALQRHLVERGLGKALKGKGGGLIESLLGIRRQ
jgi:hypothetical protein